MTRLEREAKKLEPGTEFFVNAVNLSDREIEFLRASIRNGSITVCAENFVLFSKKPDVVERVANGHIIAPQGFYRKAV